MTYITSACVHRYKVCKMNSMWSIPCGRSLAVAITIVMTLRNHMRSRFEVLEITRPNYQKTLIMLMEKRRGYSCLITILVQRCSNVGFDWPSLMHYFNNGLFRVWRSSVKTRLSRILYLIQTYYRYVHLLII